MHHPVQLADDPTVSLPLKFAGGFGIESRRIGIIFTVFAISCTMCQFLLFPPIARYLGVVPNSISHLPICLLRHTILIAYPRSNHQGSRHGAALDG
jgi:hypothetical protein